MAKRTARRAIRDKLDRAAGNIEKAEGLMAECVGTYFERGTHEGALLDQLREGCVNYAKLVRDFRSTRT